jgi:hypothetical protein
MRITPIIAACALVACGGEDEKAAPKPHGVKAPVRGAVADQDLRVMLAEIASSKACDMILGSYRGLRGKEDPNTVTGLMQMRECKLHNDGTNVTFTLGGVGWQWADQTQKKAGGTFQLREYVKFNVKATLKGPIDIAYDRDKHVASIWFSPTTAPDVKFEPIGDVDVDEKGLWSDVIGGLSSVFGASPDAQGEKQAKKQGSQEFEDQLGDGMTVAIDLCTGYQRFSMGRPQKGEMGPADPGESKEKPVALQPGGLIAFGPFKAPDGMTVKIESQGPVRVGLACEDDVKAAVDAFVNEKPLPQIATLEQADVNGSGTLKIKAQRCKVAFVAKSLSQERVTFGWQRPASEIAQSTGGPAIRCDRKSTLSSKPDDDRSAPRAGASSAARRP